MNFNPTIKQNKQNIVFLGHNSIQRAKVFTWREYIDHIQATKDWLTVLKIALEIYNGNIKGYAKVADEKDVRES